MSTTHIYDVAETKSHRKAERNFKLLKATWLVHRYAIIGLLAYFAGVSLYLVIKFPDVSSIENLSYSEFFNSNDPEVMNLASTLARRFGNYEQYLFLVPIFSAAFVGAPLISRTFETGTYKNMWTQGAGRFRTVRTEIEIFLVITIVGAFGVATVFQNYWNQPIVFRASGRQDLTGFNPWNWDIYGLIAQPVIYAAFAALCLALAIFLGAFFKRTVVAMALTLVIAASFFAVAPKVLHAGQQLLAHQLRTDDPNRVRPETAKIFLDVNLMLANGQPNSEMLMLDRGWIEADGSLTSYQLDPFVKRDVQGTPIKDESGMLVLVSDGPEYDAILRKINKPFVVTWVAPADFPKFVALECGLLVLMSVMFLGLTGLVIKRRS